MQQKDGRTKRSWEDRNDNLRNRFETGVPIKTLLEEFKITRARLYQLCRGLIRKIS